MDQIIRIQMHKDIIYIDVVKGTITLLQHYHGLKKVTQYQYHWEQRQGFKQMQQQERQVKV